MPPQFKIPAAAVASEINFNLKETFHRFATMKGPKLDPPGGTTFDFKGVHFPTPFLNTFPLHEGPKLGPQQVESGASLEVRF